MTDIRLHAVTKRFGDLAAVNGIDLAVEAGEVLCLLGPSGCGKTTTLRMIGGLESASSGDILIAGRRVNKLTPAERNIAMVFQFYALYPSLTVAENLAYPLHAERLGRHEIAARVRRVAGILDLEGVLDRLPGRLAEGEKQRVAVGRAIVRKPSCFLFDEPLSRLDVRLRQTMRTQIKEVLAGLDRATVIVTHDQVEALTMADRIAVMRDGVIEQVATPHELFAAPANLFVASFIGTPQMNLLDAVLTRRDGASGDGAALCRFRVIGEEVSLAVQPGVARLAIGARVTLGMRPRSLEIVADGTEFSLPATVDIVEPMGAETLLHLMEKDVELRCVVDRRAGVRPGERIRLRCKPRQVHVFDAEGRLVRR